MVAYAVSQTSNFRAMIIGGASILVGVSLFIFADVYGSSVRVGYSPFSDTISELIETNAPNKLLLDLLIGTYHSLLVPFAIGLHIAIRNGPSSLIGPSLLAFAGFLGVVLTAFFPCDVGCEPVTPRGTAHIFIAVPMGFAIILAIFALGRPFSRLPDWDGLATYSTSTAIVGLLLAFATVVYAESSFVGLLERVLTLSYLQWFVVIGVLLLKSGLRGDG